MVTSLGVVLLVAGLVLAGRSLKDDLYRALGNLAEVVHLVHAQYVDEVDLGALGEGLDAGIVESVDPWSAVLDDSELEAYTRLLDEPPAYGLVLALRLGSPAVRGVIPGSPAETAGFADWEVLDEIEGMPTRGMPLWRIRLMLDRHQRQGKALHLAVFDRDVQERREVVIEAVQWAPRAVDVTSVDGVRVIAVGALQPGAAADLAAVLGSERRILDLRGLGWGQEQEALAAADLFVGSGELGSWKGRRAGESTFPATPKTVSQAQPVVLVGPNTEGVGEILAAALQRSGCTLVGGRTAGHMPHMMLVHDSGLHLWLPVAHWLRGDGTAIDGNGIEPDEKVDAGGEDEDPVLDRALEIVRTDHAKAA